MVLLDCPGVSNGVLGCPMVSCGNQMHPVSTIFFLKKSKHALPVRIAQVVEPLLREPKVVGMIPGRPIPKALR